MNDNDEPGGLISLNCRYLGIHRPLRSRSTGSFHSERAGSPKSRKALQLAPAAGAAAMFDKLREGVVEIVQICDQASPKKRHKPFSSKAGLKDREPDSTKDGKHRRLLERVRKLLTSLLEELGPSTALPPLQDEDTVVASREETVDDDSVFPPSVPGLSHPAKVQIFGLDMKEKAKVSRKPYSEERRKETHNTRKRGACPDCKKSRKRCKEDHALVRVPAKLAPVLLKPKPDKRHEETQAENSAEQSQTPANPESPVDYRSVTNTGIHSPDPSRMTPIFHDLFSDFNNFSTTAEILPLPPRQTTPEIPRLHAGPPRALVRKPSLPEVRRADANPWSWSNYRKHHGQRRSLDDLDFDQYVARAWPQHNSSLSGFEISPMMLQSDDQCPVPISPAPMIGHPSNLAYVQGSVAGCHEPEVQEHNALSHHAPFSIQADQEIHAMTAEHNAAPIDIQGAPSLDLLADRSEKHCNGSCGLPGCSCQTIPPQMSAEEPQNILSDLVSVSPNRPTALSSESNAPQAFNNPEGAPQLNFVPGNYQNQSPSGAGPFDTELAGFDPELLAFLSIPSSVPQVFLPANNTGLSC